MAVNPRNTGEHCTVFYTITWSCMGYMTYMDGQYPNLCILFRRMHEPQSVPSVVILPSLPITHKTAGASMSLVNQVSF